MSTVFLNGEFIPLEEAQISPLDRGFLFSDSVYEVIPVYHQNLFSFEMHMNRLQKSLSAIKLNYEVDLESWRDIIHKLIASLDEDHQKIYIQISRGTCRERDHILTCSTTPTVFAMTSALNSRDMTKIKPVKAITKQDIRWSRCNIKSTSLLPNILLRFEAESKDAYEAILIRDDFVTEGTRSNIFVVRDDKIYTPKKSRHLLGGITRELVIQLGEQHDMPVVECDIHKEDLFHADEIWMTSTSNEIQPIGQVDDISIANGENGPIWHKMMTLFNEFKQGKHHHDGQKKVG